MPNWCSTFLTLDSNGTPAGDAAIMDFHNKLKQATQKYCGTKTDCIGRSYYHELWECDIAEFFNVGCNCYHRGYVTYLSELDNNTNSFSIECADAWSANIGFWYYLLEYLYGKNTIIVNFTASEPGMGIYVYSDPGYEGRYVASINVWGQIEDLYTFDKLFDFSDPLFPRLISPEVSIHNGLSYKDYKGNYHYSPTNVEFSAEAEGDEDEIFAFMEEYKTLPDNATIDDIEEIPNVSINGFELVDVEQDAHLDYLTYCNINIGFKDDHPLPPPIIERKDPCEVNNNGNA